MRKWWIWNQIWKEWIHLLPTHLFDTNSLCCWILLSSVFFFFSFFLSFQMSPAASASAVQSNAGEENICNCQPVRGGHNYRNYCTYKGNFCQELEKEQTDELSRWVEWGEICEDWLIDQIRDLIFSELRCVLVRFPDPRVSWGRLTNCLPTFSGRTVRPRGQLFAFGLHCPRPNFPRTGKRCNYLGNVSLPVQIWNAAE